MATAATSARPTHASAPTRDLDRLQATSRGRLPGGWRHAGAVRYLRRQPRERREAILTAAFAVAAAVWAPLGILTVLAGHHWAFIALSGLAVVAVAAPRPASLAATLESTRAGAIAGRTGLLRALRVASGYWRRAAAAARPVVRELVSELRPVPAEFGRELRALWSELVAATAPALQSARGRIERGAAEVRDRLAAAMPEPRQG